MNEFINQLSSFVISRLLKEKGMKFETRNDVKSMMITKNEENGQTKRTHNFHILLKYKKQIFRVKVKSTTSNITIRKCGNSLIILNRHRHLPLLHSSPIPPHHPTHSLNHRHHHVHLTPHSPPHSHPHFCANNNDQNVANDGSDRVDNQLPPIRSYFAEYFK